MPVRAESGALPAWDDLFAQARAQAGYFTTQDAADHHIGTALLTHHVRTGWLLHPRRGIFRFAQYAPAEREELVPLWLWSGRKGLFSHETALSLQELSDLAPTHVDLTLPEAWRGRRLKVPEGLVLHFAEVPRGDRSSWGPVPCTTLVRTLNDCLDAGVEEQFLEQAVREASRSGLLLAEDRERLAPPLRRWAPRKRARRRPR